MAGGKLTPRQKMINLMYLVFIAMLALNMSKEVLSAFGLMNEKLEASNTDATTRNKAFMDGLAEKVKENDKQYGPLKANADKVKVLADDLNSYLEGLKQQMLKTVDNPKDYEVMDKGDFLDGKFFVGDKVSKEGEVFLAKIAAFRDGVATLVPNVATSVKSKFATVPVKNRDGVSIDWLDYHYKGFPLVASLTKLTQLQADVKTTESEVLGTMLQGNLASQVSMKNYKAMIILDKNAYFQGEKVTGTVVLGRYDENTKPISVTGATLDPATGQAKINMTAGAVGEQKLGGEFKFMEGGETINLPYNGVYVVVPRPNSATISADKMNVVYRGVANPMTISFAGVPTSDVKANAPGLSGGAGGKYMMNPGAGREVVINVSAKMSDGKMANDKKVFRIKNIPGPTGALRGRETGTIKGPKSNLEVQTVNAILEDFDFDVKLDVVGFNIKVPGQPTIVVSGNKLDGRAKAAVQKATRGDVVIFSEIKTKLVGSPIMLPKTAPVAYEIQ